MPLTTKPKQARLWRCGLPRYISYISFHSFPFSICSFVRSRSYFYILFLKSISYVGADQNLSNSSQPTNDLKLYPSLVQKWLP